jgi:hypothetical protein
MITKYIPGVLIGAVIASAAFLLLDRSRDDKSPASSESEHLDKESPAIGVDGRRLPSDSGERNFPVTDVVQSGEPPKDAAEFIGISGPSCRGCLPPDEELPPPDLPIHLPRELEWLRKTDTFRRFERRPIDPVWSPQAEIQLSNYFAMHQEFVSVYGMPTILQCRARVCMASFIAPGYLDHARSNPNPRFAKYGVGSAGSSSLFEDDFKGFFDDPVAKQFSDRSDLEVTGYIRDGLAMFYMLLPRRKPEK